MAGLEARQRVLKTGWLYWTTELLNTELHAYMVHAYLMEYFDVIGDR